MSALSSVGFDARHGLRLQRFELGMFAVLVAAVTASAIGFAGLLESTGFAASCSPFRDVNPPGCEALGGRFWELQNGGIGQILRTLLTTLPFLLGVIAGVPVVARELERGTARLAWSLAPSRGRWFVARLAPVLAVVLVLSIACGYAADRLIGAVNPWSDAWPSFTDFGSRGTVLAARALFVFALGVLCGAVVGRSLPALLVTVVIASVAISGGAWLHGRWMATEAVFVADDETGQATSGALFFDQRLREDATGRIVDWDAFYAEHPELENSDVWPPSGFSYANLVVPAERAPFMAARETVVLAGGSIVVLGLAGLWVRRRRPG